MNVHKKKYSKKKMNMVNELIVSEDCNFASDRASLSIECERYVFMS